MINQIIAGVKGVMRRMGLLKALKDVKDHKKVNANDEDYKYIDMWKRLYQGHYAEWHNLNYEHNGNPVNRRQLSMNLPKVTAKYMSKLLFNEKVKINIDDKAAEEFVLNVLKTNGFTKNMERYIEYGEAMGGFVIKVYHDGKNVKVSFATADCMYPLSNDSENVDECVIANSFHKNNKYYKLLEWNEWKGKEEKVYTITTELYQSDNPDELGGEVSLKLLFNDIEPVVPLPPLTRPTFIYIKPNIANNKNLTSPLGISIYANALDTLKTLDLMFDSYYQEFKLGKKKVLVPSSFVKTAVNLDGSTSQYFDSTDEAFFLYQGDQDADGKSVKDISVEIRSTEFIESINAMLRIYAMQVGLSAGTFTFDENGLKTATEVVSEKSETYQTKNSHSQLIEQGIKEMIVSILEVGKFIEAYSGDIVELDTITVDFDDSIAQDEDTTINRYTNAKNQGMIPLKIALQRAWNITDAEAEEWKEEIEKDGQSSLPENDLSGLFGDIELPDKNIDKDTEQNTTSGNGEEMTFNGAQMDSLYKFVKGVANGEIPYQAGLNTILKLFPFTEEEVKEMLVVDTANITAAREKEKTSKKEVD
ncbi:phage portal protein [Listeria monocytogenes]|uniref:phage portal protein n=1 Tax=Listeria monocytogenes TaxID=1639 RepID=UPI0010DEF913|nr:phage portal protein [Listeria monocytogenes]EAC9888700.1 phage portal protein [Listeria monocytogenes]EIM1745198.1 phage portal protein [Listeria monocytogenes]EIM1834640.1 phage portal protein [Listeria monocytogenes]EIM1903078.1 phage portal protein [Listeria monocytogenes]EIM1978185.1 phage portal protein [Listeria monocytogenes]